MTVKLLTDNLEFLSLKGGCTGSSESTLVKMPHCWKSHTTAHIYVYLVGAIILDLPFLKQWYSGETITVYRLLTEFEGICNATTWLNQQIDTGTSRPSEISDQPGHQQHICDLMSN